MAGPETHHGAPRTPPSEVPSPFRQEAIERAAQTLAAAVTPLVARSAQALAAKAALVVDRSAQALATAAAPVIDRWAAEADRALEPAREWLRTQGPQFGRVYLALQKYSAEAHVENWKELTEPEDWTKALDLMRLKDGVPLAWVPPARVVGELVAAADHAARNEVLLAHADVIAADGRRMLGEVVHEDLAALHAAITAAWDAWEADLKMPAQAMAAAVVSSIINEHLGFKRFSDFRKQWEPLYQRHPDKLLMVTRTNAVNCSLAVAVLHKNQGPFVGFHRHETVHGLSAAQYTPVNALRALMLATSAARELQFAIADEWLAHTTLRPPQQLTGGVRITDRGDPDSDPAAPEASAR
ncbi:MAG: hypothetical protein M3Y17_06790 [Actinomycetota bacterium]|nr:hypothetical protein [Actinomycetota bacterium]